MRCACARIPVESANAMNLGDKPEKTARGNAEITPHGSVHLGKRLALEQHPDVEPTTGYLYSTGLPEDGLISQFESSLPLAHPGELTRQELKYSLREADDDLLIDNAGLTVSYGIF